MSPLLGCRPISFVLISPVKLRRDSHGILNKGILSAVPGLLPCATRCSRRRLLDQEIYQNWSADETHRLLEESPWATTLSLRGIQAVVTSGDSVNNTSYRGEMETDPSISYALQFRSARPIREAQVRSSQLNSQYPKFSGEQKAAFNFLLLSVWACPVGGVREKNYVGQIYEAIVRHPKWFNGDVPTMICGDFNSNTIFDPGRKKRTHSTVVQLLAEKGLTSGPTYYFWHRKERRFHIDYIFVPSSWIEFVIDFKVGTYKRWRPMSDHVPIMVDIAEAA
jgi:hypothetical protein